ncbi:MAG: hypothetical protein IH628_06005 [Proteobacteria bacterium]|nr:hypothetical protein [Pseudomonadota bacterium]
MKKFFLPLVLIAFAAGIAAAGENDAGHVTPPRFSTLRRRGLLSGYGRFGNDFEQSPGK